MEGGRGQTSYSSKFKGAPISSKHGKGHQMKGLFKIMTPPTLKAFSHDLMNAKNLATTRHFLMI
jgi:hypothetical protein